ncbi:MAG: M23 family metallopeptidase [Bacteroidales bacterium]|nr:M23 family metallopeptidase [Bacteroidales bacterium]
MAKTKYHFDHKSLTFKKVQRNFKDIFKKAVFLFSGFVVFSTVAVILAFYFVDSPKEKALRREIERFKTQHEIINERLDIITAVLQDIQQRDDNIYRVILEAEPVSEAERNAGIGGVNRYAELENYDNSVLMTNVATKLDKISRQLYVQSKSFDEVLEMARNKSEMLASIPSIVPLSNATSRLVSGFGYRVHPIYKTLRMHTGVDFTAPRGTPVYASGNGTVKNINRRHFSGYGILCVIDHGYGYETLYGHLSRLNVRPGQKVVRGEVIGYVGSSGLSVGPHLHYEVLKNGNPVNPINFFYNDLTPEEYEIIIEKASEINQALS